MGLSKEAGNGDRRHFMFRGRPSPAMIAPKFGGCFRNGRAFAWPALLLAASLTASLIAGCSRSGIPEPSRAPGTDAATPPVTKEPEVSEQAQRLASAKDERRAHDDRLWHARDLITRFPDSPEAGEAKAMLDAMGEPVVPPKWNYTTRKDSMSGDQFFTASVMSENTLSFGFPYEGVQHGMLLIRKHPTHGNEVIVSIQRGQILCNSYSSCPIRVAFDDGKPRTLRGTDAADGSTEYVFLPGFASLSRQIFKAKEMRVQFDVYQQGSPVLVFDVKGFEPEKMQ